MKAYLLSLGAGLLVGVVYSLLDVRSPAPPVVALIGLLGILLGEQIIPAGRQMITATSIRTACKQVRCSQHVLGAMPGRHAVPPRAQWVGVVGGFGEPQFMENRLSTLEEINAVPPDTPVFLAPLYHRALLSAAALRAVGYTKGTTEPTGGQIVRGARGAPVG